MRKADGVRHCRKDVPYWQSPIEITLSNGQRFTAPSSGQGYGRGISALPEMPDADVIEQLAWEGPPALIQNNEPIIKRVLAQESQRAEAPDNARGLWFGAGGLLGGLCLFSGLRRIRRRR